MFGAARIHVGMGWGRKKEAPLTQNIKVKTESGYEWRAVPIKDHPFMLTMVDLPRPGILWSKNKVANYQCFRVVISNTQKDFQRSV